MGPQALKYAYILFVCVYVGAYWAESTYEIIGQNEIRHTHTNVYEDIRKYPVNIFGNF